MVSLSFKEFQQAAKQGNLIPIYDEVPADLDTPVSAFLKIRTGKNDFLLESVEGGEKWARYSFLGSNPSVIFSSKNGKIEIKEGRSTQILNVKTDPLKVLKKKMKEYKPVKVKGLPRFYGGAVGCLGYDVVRNFEKLPDAGRDDLNLPDVFFMITDTLILFDNFRQVIMVVANIHLKKGDNLSKKYDEALRKIKSLTRKLKSPFSQKHVQTSKKKETKLVARHTSKQYEKMVERVKEYIAAGDVFQTVISTRFEGETDVKPFELYRCLRRLNPSPYMYYIETDDFCVVGASPEVMVRMEDRKVSLRPIAGTRKRGKNYEEDLALEEELKADPKERAEHIMLVDLGRNDLGRISKVGTVKVDELEVIERYSHVMHIVSHVSGVLKAGKDAYDIIRAAFPAGTLSGAPKIRAMEIIDEMEMSRRGFYGGCVGYIGFSGNLDTAITIRTALFKGKKVYVQAGAGIVYNSDPKMEYKECKNKAQSLVRALEMCENK